MCHPPDHLTRSRDGCVVARATQISLVDGAIEAEETVAAVQSSVIPSSAITFCGTAAPADRADQAHRSKES